MTDDSKMQLLARLRNAEARLAKAERAQINTASAQYGSDAGGSGDLHGTTAKLNAQIRDATGLDALRSEAARLRAEVAALGADDQRPSAWARFLGAIGLRPTDPVAAATAEQHARETREKAAREQNDGRGPTIVAGG